MSIGNDIHGGASNALRNLEVDDANALRHESRLDPFGGEGIEEPDPPQAGYPYGLPSVVVRESNYISDDNLLAWLAMKQEGLYGELRDHMDMSRARSKLIEDLAHLKDLLDRGATRATALSEINALLEAYKDSPFADDIDALVGPARDELLELDSHAPEDGPMISGVMKGLSEAIQSRIDALGRDDQLELIEIQSLTADIRENAQLVSNLLAGSNQTANTIVGNIAR